MEQSLLAVEGLMVDFGAVDVVWNDQYQKAYVLEVNTAPGIENSTVLDYATAVETLLY